jgi:hypothetical protein
VKILLTMLRKILLTAHLKILLTTSVKKVLDIYSRRSSFGRKWVRGQAITDISKPRRKAFDT